MIAVAIGADQFGAVRRLAAGGQAPPPRRALGEAFAARAERLLQYETVFRLCRAAMGRSPFLQSPDQVVVHVAHQQLSHPRYSLPLRRTWRYACYHASIVA